MPGKRGEIVAWVDGVSARDLLLMVLGDYWVGSTAPIPSGALVAVLEEFGVSMGNTRAALRRLVSRGVLESSREGRSTYYGFSETAARVGLSRGLQLMGFGRACADCAWASCTTAVGSPPTT
jgi:phenylacetic acid degradation operon negative regulatory protein